MNKRPKAGTVKVPLNGVVWVSGSSEAGLTESMIYQQAGPSLGPMFDARERRRAGPGDAKHLFVEHPRKRQRFPPPILPSDR